MKSLLNKFKLEVSESGAEAYLYLPTHPTGSFRTSKTVRLLDLIDNYPGPDLLFDFGPDGTLVGVEILLDEDPEDDSENG